MNIATSPSAKKKLEIEVKLRIANREGLPARLKKLGFSELCHRQFEDNWILDSRGKRLLREHCLLRLRHFEGKSFVTFKGPKTASRHFKIREELETEVAEGEKFHQILDRLGFIAVFRYQKYRSIFVRAHPQESKRLIITIDETPIGDYLEIEGSTENIRTISGQLGYRPRDFVTQSYLELYFKNNPRSKQRQMIFQR
jgi:adenylate cyclase, class 2